MSKFVIECPSCGKYAEASFGFLGLMATREIKCTCGYTIRIKSDKLSSKICDHCGNTVIFNWSKGEKALCPVCHERLNILEGRSSLVELTCPVCSCKVFANKNDEVCTCVLCNTTIDIRKQLEKEKVKKDGIASVIKYEGSNDVFVWKHPIEDFNLGSQLIVHESQEAIFFRDGKALDLFSSGRYTLATQNLPLLESLYKLPLNANEVFHSEIYFINMVTQMGIKWGTDSKVRLFDPGSGLYVELGACGTFNLRVANSRKLLLKLVALQTDYHKMKFLDPTAARQGRLLENSNL
ncbi:SPFH domain-containing protein [Clostridium sp. AM58-1XD]|uniref:SPFH domain-containing protein n=1 Tax=Clostridium sp. AM58-1XD TaxID=2292307 RepID=UPI000E4E8522|nr:SPFH domain-containing protein [Clostridium sp. AM58-1XD]RGY96664.1 hypothetical protein DXA13_16690 [Clostridium sp. AM58-1XD]